MRIPIVGVMGSGSEAHRGRSSQVGQWLALEGVHLLLPGHGDSGPTLEIYTYTETLDAEPGEPNRRGISHLAFEVDDVEEMVRSLEDRGGSLMGEVSQGHVEGVGLLTFVYARDPEGNIIELQSWRREPS